MRIFLLLFFFSCSINAQAQTWKDKLNSARQAAKDKVKRKVDNKINNEMDEAVDKVDSLVTGKKKIKSKKKNTDDGNQEEFNQGNGTRLPAVTTANSEFVIQTNIKCLKGKQFIEDILRNENNVSSVSVDSDTGKIYLLTPNGDRAVYENALSIIAKNGFSADTRKT